MPIPNTLKFEKIEKKEYEPIPANVYQVQIGDISEKYKTPWGKPDAEEKELYLTFEFVILDGQYKGRKLWKDIRPVAPTPSEGGSFKPSWMYRLVSAVVGHPLSLAEGINWGAEETNNLIGRQLRLIVNQTPKNAQGRSYNNITEVLPIDKEIEPLLADNVQSEGHTPIETEDDEDWQGIESIVEPMGEGDEPFIETPFDEVKPASGYEKFKAAAELAQGEPQYRPE